MVLNFCEILVMQFLNMPQTGFRLGRALMLNDKVVGFLIKVVEGCYFLNILDEILCLKDFVFFVGTSGKILMLFICLSVSP